MFPGGFNLSDLNPFKIDSAFSQTPESPQKKCEETPLEKRDILSCRDFDRLYKEGISDYADKDLGTCVYGLTQESFDFWCYGAKNGKLFTDNDRFTDNDGLCDAWHVYNYDYDVVPCGNKIFHVADWWDWHDIRFGAELLDDDYNEIFLVLKAMETRTKDGVPGIALWSSKLVSASRNFAEPAKLLTDYPDLRGKFLAALKPLTEKEYESRGEAAMELFTMMNKLGGDYDAEKLTFYTPWKEMDKKSNGNDWVTPLIHAGALVNMMNSFVREKSDYLFEQLERGSWYMIVGDNSLQIVTDQGEQIEVWDYFNDRIWRRPGETKENIKTNLLSEIKTAITKSEKRSGERCYNCMDAEEFAIDVEAQLAKLMGFLKINEETKSKLGKHAETSLEICCHQTPPRLYDEASKKCTGLTAAQACFSEEPPAFFDPEACVCEAMSAGMHCYTLEPQGHHVFELNKETMKGECVRCKDSTPITNDGLTCTKPYGVKKKEPLPPPRPPRPPEEPTTTTTIEVLPRCTFDEIQAGQRGTTCR